jgi:exonuclease III
MCKSFDSPCTNHGCTRSSNNSSWQEPSCLEFQQQKQATRFLKLKKKALFDCARQTECQRTKFSWMKARYCISAKEQSRGTRSLLDSSVLLLWE